MPQFIYTMKGLGKVHPPDHVVLKDIWLSFLPGAKIGVLGLNGAGKSSLLKIMAGEDKNFVGEAWPAEGISVGFLHQEPRLDPTKTVLGNVEEGVAEIKALLTRYDEINAKLGEELSPEADGQGPRGAGQGAGQDRSGQRVGPRLAPRAGDGRAAPAAGGRRRHEALGRRAPPRRAVPAAAQVARPAAARRADQPSRRRVGRLARALPQGLPGHRRRGHARSLLPRQRRRLDPRARSRRGHPVGRQLLVLARAEAEPPRAGREDREQAPADARARARMDPHVAARAPGQGQGAPQHYEDLLKEETREEDRADRDLHSARARGSATSSSRRAT